MLGDLLPLPRSIFVELTNVWIEVPEEIDEGRSGESQRDHATVQEPFDAA
jgi:hypothetical protein